MEPIIKELLDEMNAYADQKDITVHHLQQAEKVLKGYSNLVTLIFGILNWNNLKIQSVLKEDPKKLPLTTEGIDPKKTFMKKMVLFVENCAPFRQVFEIKGEFLYYKEELSEEQVQEIKQYITDITELKVDSVYITQDKIKD
ncbi:hypothetical protein [Dokdonia sp.]|uniref:hypothetical protein n=1 Tax=Dokdonia sp. TaxID=2024995 RepID=UPI00326573B4